MSEKVTITREQAEAIETELKDESKVDIVEYHIKHNYTSDVPIAKENMSTDKLIKALYIGYEVEPEYEVGEWVVLKDGRFAELTKFITHNDGDTNWAGDVWCNYRKDRYGIAIMHDEIKRHATPSEIAAEKEWRWWNKHGRYVKEVRKGDIIYSYSTGITFVKSKNNRYVTNFDGFRVICFAESRLDVSE